MCVQVCMCAYVFRDGQRVESEGFPRWSVDDDYNLMLLFGCVMDCT